MSIAWSDEQQRYLVALGYTLYQPVAAAATRASDDTETASLMRALLHAANRDPATLADAHGWLHAQQVPSLAQLRSDPAAKRALWPRLRELRRERVDR